MQVELLDLKPKRNPKLRWRIYKNKTIIEPAIGLNETGSIIWRLCDGSKTVQQIIESLQEAFSGNPTRIASSTIEFLKLMRKHKLIII